jgi:hypothetical protein
MPPRNGRGGFVRTLDNAARDGEACRLHAQGWTIREISEHLGYGSPGNAHRGIQRALAEAASLHGARELREVQIAELSELRRKMWALVNDPPPLVDKLGRVVKDDDGNPVPDAAAVVNAASVIIRAADRLARLTGIDSPRRSVSTVVDIPIADLQAATEVLRVQFGLPAGDGAEASRPMLSGTAEAVGQTEAV